MAKRKWVLPSLAPPDIEDRFSRWQGLQEADILLRKNPQSAQIFPKITTAGNRRGGAVLWAVTGDEVLEATGLCGCGDQRLKGDPVILPGGAQS